MHSTNATNTFIMVAPDTTATEGQVPPERATPSVASRMYRMIREAPYQHTSDDVIFGVFADRKGLPPEARAAAREAFFAKPQACLRASDLARRYGWGIHSNAQGRVALYGVETAEYRAFARGKCRGSDDAPVRVIAAMRSRR